MQMAYKMLYIIIDDIKIETLLIKYFYYKS
jgi:hypothetical protein